MAEEESLTRIKSLARGYTDLSVKVLGGIAKDGTSEGARVAAAVALLDRGWGKPAQAHAGPDGDGAVKHEIIIRDIAAERAALKK